MEVPRLGFLDSLRGFAAVYVLSVHLAFVPSPAPPLPDIIQIPVLFGGTGTTLFFVMSAFSLCFTMDRHKRAVNPWLSYSISRVFRILPLFYVLLVLFSVLWLWLPLYFGPVSPQVVALNVALIFNLLPGYEQGIVWGSWTIGVEVILYCMFPFLYTCLSTRVRRLGVLAAALACSYAFLLITPHLIADPKVRAYFEVFSIVTRLPSFLAGMIAFDVYQAQRRRTAPWAGWILIGSGFVVLCVTAMVMRVPLTMPQPPWPSPMLILSGLHLTALGYALLMLGLAVVPWRLFVNRYTRLWGTFSYSIYLWHGLVLWFMGPVFGWVILWEGPPLATYAACLFIAITTMTVVGFVSYRLIELPGIQLGRALLEAIGQVRGTTKSRAI